MERQDMFGIVWQAAESDESLDTRSGAT